MQVKAILNHVKKFKSFVYAVEAVSEDDRQEGGMGRAGAGSLPHYGSPGQGARRGAGRFLD